MRGVTCCIIRRLAPLQDCSHAMADTLAEWTTIACDGPPPIQCPPHNNCNSIIPSPSNLQQNHCAQQGRMQTTRCQVCGADVDVCLCAIILKFSEGGCMRRQCIPFIYICYFYSKFFCRDHLPGDITLQIPRVRNSQVANKSQTAPYHSSHIIHEIKI